MDANAIERTFPGQTNKIGLHNSLKALSKGLSEELRRI